MPTTIAKIVEGFLFPHLSPIIGNPTYDSLAELHLKLNTNAASVHSSLGHGLLCLLFFTISPAVYNTLSVVSFAPLVNPGATVIIPIDTTDPAVVTLRRTHGIALVLFNKCNNTNKALK